MRSEDLLLAAASSAPGGPALLGELAALDSDSALRRKLRQYAAPDLLVINEVGYRPGFVRGDEWRHWMTRPDRHPTMLGLVQTVPARCRRMGVEVARRESIVRLGQHPHVCRLAICVEAHDLAAPLGNRQHQIPGAQLQCHDGAACVFTSTTMPL